MEWLRYKGKSPFDDGGRLEVLKRFPEGAEILIFPESPQEFFAVLDIELKKMAQELQVLR
jgi:hypothetical protein